MVRRRTAALLSALLLVIASDAFAQSYAITWNSINGGGGSSASTSYNLNACIGQPIAGLTVGSSTKLWGGYLVPEPFVVQQIQNAKMLPDGTTVSLTGMIASSGYGDFTSFLYVQDVNRSSGIRIASAPTLDLTRGMSVNVVGDMGTLSTGERQIVNATLTRGAQQTVPGALGIINRNLGGGTVGTPPTGQYGVHNGTGANNIGLLAKTWGVVMAKTSTYMLIDDGSGVNVYVDITGKTVLPGLNDYAAVTGLSSIYLSGGFRERLILPRSAADVQRM